MVSLSLLGSIFCVHPHVPDAVMDAHEQKRHGRVQIKMGWDGRCKAPLKRAAALSVARRGAAIDSLRFTSPEVAIALLTVAPTMT